MPPKDPYIYEDIKVTFDLTGTGKVIKMFRLPLLSIRETIVFRMEYEKYGGAYVMEQLIEQYKPSLQHNQDTIEGLHNAMYMDYIQFEDVYEYIAKVCADRYLDLLEQGCNGEMKHFIEVMDALSEKWNISPMKIQEELSFRDLHDYAEGTGIELDRRIICIEGKEQQKGVLGLFKKLTNIN